MRWKEWFRKFESTTPELSRKSLKEHFWLISSIFLFTALVIPAFFFIPKFYQWVHATTWNINSDIDKDSQSTGYMGSLVITSDNFPAVTYANSGCLYYSKLATDGTFSASSSIDCRLGVLPTTWAKSEMLLAPDDNQPSVLYKKWNSTHQIIYADYNGSTWTTTTLSTSSSFSYIGHGLAFDGSNTPLFVYSEGWGSTGGVVYFQSGTGGAKTEILSDAGINRYDSLALQYLSASSTPVVFYKDSTELKMMYPVSGVWTEDPNVIDGALPTVAAGLYMRMSASQDASGVLRVYYQGGTSAQNLLFGVRTAAGTWTTTTIYSAAAVDWLWGTYNTANSYDGVAFRDANNQLKYTQNSIGSWSTETASSTNSPGYYAHLTYFAGSPVIAYQYIGAGAVLRNSIISGASAFGNTAPGAPTDIYVSTSTAQLGYDNPRELATTTPNFSAIFNDTDGGEVGNKAQLQVTTSSITFASPTHWDSGAAGNTITNVNAGSRSQDIKYGSFGTAPTKDLALRDDGEGPDATLYYWRIRFWDDGGSVGAWSTTSTFSISDLPEAPSNVAVAYAATGDNYPKATLTWTDNSNNETEFEVLGSTDNITFTHFASSSAGSTDTWFSTAGSALQPNTKYYWKMRAYNNSGFSAYTDAVSGSVGNDYTYAAVPSNLAVSSVSNCIVYLTTEANGNPEGTNYQLSIVDPSSTWAWQTSRSFTASTPITLTGGKLYTFRVKAKNANDMESAYSSSVTAATVPQPPEASSMLGDKFGVSYAAGTIRFGMQPDADLGCTNDSAVTYNIYNIAAKSYYTWQSYLIWNSSNNTFNFTPGQSFNFYAVARSPEEAGYVLATSSLFSVVVQNSGVFIPPVDVLPMQETIKINGETMRFENGLVANITELPDVSLSFTFGTDKTEMQISNDPALAGASWQGVRSVVPWVLPTCELDACYRTVYARFRGSGGATSIISATVKLLGTGTRPAATTFLQPTRDSAVEAQPVFVGTVPADVREVKLFFDTVSTLRAAFPTGVPAQIDASQQYWIYRPTEMLPPGRHTVRARTFNALGMYSATDASVSFNVVGDALPGKPVILSPQNGDVLVSARVTVTGTGDPGLTIVLVRDSLLTYSATVDGTGRWSIPLADGLSDGVHSIEVAAYDIQGRQSETTTVRFMVQAPISLLDDSEDESLLPDLIEERPPIAELEQRLNELTSVPPEPASPEEELATLPDTWLSDLFSTSSLFFGVSGTAPIAIVTPTSTLPATLAELPTLAAPVIEQVTRAADAVVETTKVAVKKIQDTNKQVRKTLDKPAVQTVNQTVVVPAVTMAAGAAVGTAVGTATSLPQFLLYLQFLFTQPLQLLRRRRAQQSGVVFNAVSKMPVDLAVVRVMDEATGKVMKSRVTDIHGRYEFFVDPGQYKLEVSKPKFIFPSVLLSNKKEDDKYTNLYNGEEIKAETELLLTYNAPVDPAGKEESTEFILRQAWKRHLASVVSLAGIMGSTISFVVSPKLWVGGMVIIHTGLYFLMRRLARPPQPQNWGVVMDEKTKKPLGRAVVRIFDTQYNKLLETQVTDGRGRYAFLVGNNEYYIMVDKPGFARFTSTPIAIKDAKEGATIALDVAMKEGVTVNPATPVAAAVPVTPAVVADLPIAAPATPVAAAPRYVEKEVLVSEPVAAPAAEIKPAPLMTVEKVAPLPSEKEVTRPVFASPSPATTPIAPLANKLLQPFGASTRNIVVEGVPEVGLHNNQIVSDGNLLTAFAKVEKK